MKILLISYGDYDYDGRLRELCKVFEGMGTLYAVTRGGKAQNPLHKVYNGSYPSFIREAVAYGKTLTDVDVLVMDNRKSVIPCLILDKLIHPKVVVQDCRELYVSKDVAHIAGKLGCVVEKWGIQRADIIIAANKERAEYMQEMYRLPQTPLVFANLRALAYSSPQAKEEAKQMLAPYLADDEIRILSTYGCSVDRTNDILVRNFDKVKPKARLFLVGSGPQKDEDIIRGIIREKGLTNVEILGQMNQDQLKYLISVSHIGIVNYNQKDLNNKYCASGKLYEFLYEGLPVVTTTNPPLQRMCDEYHVGCADDAYYQAINTVAENLEYYRENAKACAAENPVEENNARLIRDLQQRLEPLLNRQS